MEWLAQYGYLGLFLGSFLAATIIPFSSDFLLLGILAAGGDPTLTIIIATVGNWLGGMTCYGLGWLGKWEWIEKWLRITPQKLESQRAKIDKYGSVLAFFTWLPLVGDLMAVALGFYRINLPKSTLFMLIGKFARYLAWTLIYFWIRN